MVLAHLCILQLGNKQLGIDPIAVASFLLNMLGDTVCSSACLFKLSSNLYVHDRLTYTTACCRCVTAR